MRYEALLAFFTTVKEESFTAAARKLYLTQPAVSAAIKQLESEFGRPLLIRKPGGGFSLSHTGEQVFQIFQEINQQFEKLELLKQECSRQLKGEIIIECDTIGGFYLISLLSTKFQDIHPEILVCVKHQSNLVERVLNGDCNLILFLMPDKSSVSNSGLQLVKSWEDEHSIIVSKMHPLAGRIVPLEDLISCSFILAPRETSYRQIVDNVFQKQLGRLPNCTLELNNPEAVKQSVISLNKPGIVLKSTIWRELEEGTLISLQTNLNLRCEHILASKKSQTYSEPLNFFVKYLDNLPL